MLATGQAGDSCQSETDCAPGLACGIDGTQGTQVISTCTAHNQGRPAGSACETDEQCSNHTCALGMCVDLCRETRDCISGAGCMQVPIVDNSVSPATVGGTFNGCLPNRGSIVWDIPVSSTSAEIALPIPGNAESATVVFSVSDTAQLVGASLVLKPEEEKTPPETLEDRILYTKPCVPTGPTDPVCSESVRRNQYFSNELRHLPAPGQSVLQIPTSTMPGSKATKLYTGQAYRITTQSFRPNGAIGSSIPRVTAIVKMDKSVNLDLNFHFLDLDDHPCKAAFGGGTLNAALASTAPFFQENTDEANVEDNTYLEELKQILADGGIALYRTTYTDVRNRPDLDGLARADAGTLLSLGTHSTGIDIFFVRTITPVGIQAIGPNPGPAGLRGTRESGIAISIDSMCDDFDPDKTDPNKRWRPAWRKLARLTAHMVARYMGLYNTVELENFVERSMSPAPTPPRYSTWQDQIGDTVLDNEAPSPYNLMFFSEIKGIKDLRTVLTKEQKGILTRNAVLR
ncbi:MAG: hypothetical protein SFX73_11870 [Kofleriaceae bacterium]|nr:hypothetical protein [Kofleriaceae bacterium]